MMQFQIAAFVLLGSCTAEPFKDRSLSESKELIQAAPTSLAERGTVENAKGNDVKVFAFASWIILGFGVIKVVAFSPQAPLWMKKGIRFLLFKKLRDDLNKRDEIKEKLLPEIKKKKIAKNKEFDDVAQKADSLYPTYHTKPCHPSAASCEQDCEQKQKTKTWIHKGGILARAVSQKLMTEEQKNKIHNAMQEQNGAPNWDVIEDVLILLRKTNVQFTLQKKEIDDQVEAEYSEDDQKLAQQTSVDELTQISGALKAGIQGIVPKTKQLILDELVAYVDYAKAKKNWKNWNKEDAKTLADASDYYKDLVLAFQNRDEAEKHVKELEEKLPELPGYHNLQVFIFGLLWTIYGIVLVSWRRTHTLGKQIPLLFFWMLDMRLSYLTIKSQSDAGNLVWWNLFCLIFGLQLLIPCKTGEWFGGLIDGISSILM